MRYFKENTKSIFEWSAKLNERNYHSLFHALLLDHIIEPKHYKYVPITNHPIRRRTIHRDHDEDHHRRARAGAHDGICTGAVRRQRRLGRQPEQCGRRQHQFGRLRRIGPVIRACLGPAATRVARGFLVLRLRDTVEPTPTAPRPPRLASSGGHPSPRPAAPRIAAAERDQGGSSAPRSQG